MKNAIIAVLDTMHQLAKKLGKRGSETDILMTHTSLGDLGLTFIDPLHYPEKFRSLCHAVNLCDFIVLNINSLDSVTGEMILTTHLSGKPGLIYSQTYDEDTLRSVLKATRLKDWPFVSREPQLMEEITKINIQPERKKEAGFEIALDQAFNVKGVGTVILGTVVSGTIRVHDMIRLLPSGTTTEVRSIQVHDNNMKEAVAGERVGLALKNVDADKLKSDCTIILDGDKKWGVKTDKDELQIVYTESDIMKHELQDNFAISYLLTDATVKRIKTESKTEGKTEGNLLTVKPDKPIEMKSGLKGFVYSLQNNYPRVRGTFSFP